MKKTFNKLSPTGFEPTTFEVRITVPSLILHEGVATSRGDWYSPFNISMIRRFCGIALTAISTGVRPEGLAFVKVAPEYSSKPVVPTRPAPTAS